jgi:hypothetical protein
MFNSQFVYVVALLVGVLTIVVGVLASPEIGSLCILLGVLILARLTFIYVKACRN